MPIQPHSKHPTVYMSSRRPYLRMTSHLHRVARLDCVTSWRIVHAFLPCGPTFSIFYDSVGWVSQIGQDEPHRSDFKVLPDVSSTADAYHAATISAIGQKEKKDSWRLPQLQQWNPGVPTRPDRQYRAGDYLHGGKRSPTFVTAFSISCCFILLQG